MMCNISNFLSAGIVDIREAYFVIPMAADGLAISRHRTHNSIRHVFVQVSLAIMTHLSFVIIKNNRIFFQWPLFTTAHWSSSYIVITFWERNNPPAVDQRFDGQCPGEFREFMNVILRHSTQLVSCGVIAFGFVWPRFHDPDGFLPH